jgi:hypothetical protein
MIREGFIPMVCDVFGMWNPYEMINRVTLRAYPLFSYSTKAIRPHRDLGHMDLDTEVCVLQPALEIKYRDGSARILRVDRHRDVVTEGNAGWFEPVSPLDVWKEHQFFCRCEIDVLGRTPRYAALHVSTYLLAEMFSRRIVLAPKLSKTSQVERLLRFASEDDFVSAQIEAELYCGRNVLRDTTSFLAGVVMKDMTTRIEDF